MPPDTLSWTTRPRTWPSRCTSATFARRSSATRFAARCGSSVTSDQRQSPGRLGHAVRDDHLRLQALCRRVMLINSIPSWNWAGSTNWSTNWWTTRRPRRQLPDRREAAWRQQAEQDLAGREAGRNHAGQEVGQGAAPGLSAQVAETAGTVVTICWPSSRHSKRDPHLAAWRSNTGHRRAAAGRDGQASRRRSGKPGLWREFLPYCLEDIQRIYDRIDIQFDDAAGRELLSRPAGRRRRGLANSVAWQKPATGRSASSCPTSTRR